MENNNKKVWYKKKRYIIPLAILGLIIVFGSVNQPTISSPSAVSPSENNVPLQPSVDLGGTHEIAPLTPAPTPVVAPEPTTTNTDTLSNDNHYINVDGNTVHSPAYSNSIPAGASAICRDGTYSFSQNRRGTCSHHGGVAEWL